MPCVIRKLSYRYNSYTTELTWCPSARIQHDVVWFFAAKITYQRSCDIEGNIRLQLAFVPRVRGSKVDQEQFTIFTDDHVGSDERHELNALGMNLYNTFDYSFLNSKLVTIMYG